MLHFFGYKRYLKKVSQNKNIFCYFFGFPKDLLQKTIWIELINVLHFNEKKN
jgi:hypothetical protein